MKQVSNWEELLKESKGGQLTAQNIINRRVFSKKDGWHDIHIESDFFKEICWQIADTLGGWQKTKINVSWALRNERPQHWGLERVIIESYDGKITMSYFAGQDWNAETNQIRRYLSR